MQNFAAYEGPISLLNENYYASVAFLAVFGFAIAAAILLGTLVWLLVACALRFCCRKKVDEFETAADEKRQPGSGNKLVPKLFLFVFATAAVIGAAGIWVAGQWTDSLAGHALDLGVGHVVSGVNDAAAVSKAVAYATGLGLDLGNATTQVQDLSVAVAKFETQIYKLKKTAKDGVDSFQIATTVYAAAIAGITLFSFVFAVLHMKHGMGICNFFIWVLLVLGWVLTGIFYVSMVFSGDLCNAYDELATGTNVTQLLGCPNATANANNLNSSYYTLWKKVEDANAYIAYVQSPNVTQFMCNPVSYKAPTRTYVLNGTCPYNGAIGAYPARFGVSIGNFTSVYTAPLRCDSDNATVCYFQHRVPATTFASMVATANGTQAVVDVMPIAEDLLSCGFVLNAFNDVGGYVCGRMETTTRLFFGSFLMSSIALFPVFILLVVGYSRFTPPLFCHAGDVASKNDASMGAETGGVADPYAAPKGRLGEYVVGHNY